ncbi:MAG: outer membrane beta-barrel protein [Cyclobacteriaceae bacterium]
MIGQENTEGEFEKAWSEAIGGAEVNPPKAVWNEIDRGLAYAELSAYKSKNLYYKWAVAAVLLLAVSLSTFQFLYFNNQEIALNNEIEITSPEMLAQNASDIVVPESLTNYAKADVGYASNTSSKTNKPKFGANKAARAQGMVLANSDEELQDRSVKFSGLSVTSKQIGLLAELDETYNQAEFFKRPIYHFERATKNTGADKYWAGLGVGSGSFDPNFQSGGSSLVAQNLDFNPAAFSLSSNELVDTNSPTVREQMNAGESVSLGVNFGLKLSRRWSVQSGIQYARSGATTETNVIIQSTQIQESLPVTSQAKSVEQFVNVVENESIVEYDYRDVSLRNQFQFASVPITAGYRILDKKFSIELNAGLVTNFYMGNRLEGLDNEIAEVTIGPGSESPYKNVSFSGLAGVELGYQVMRNFDFIIQPNYRHGINSLTKDGSNFTTNPTGFGLLTGIRYNFN